MYHSSYHDIDATPNVFTKSKYSRMRFSNSLTYFVSSSFNFLSSGFCSANVRLLDGFREIKDLRHALYFPQRRPVYLFEERSFFGGTLSEDLIYLGVQRVPYLSHEEADVEKFRVARILSETLDHNVVAVVIPLVQMRVSRPSIIQYWLSSFVR